MKLKLLHRPATRRLKVVILCALELLAAYGQLRGQVTLLTTITNPAPVANDYFGAAVAAVGNNCVLIGAYADDLGTADAGAAYLFNTSGALLTTLTNPTPASGDYFGCSVAAIGSDRVLVGAMWDDRGGKQDVGAAYLFSTNGALLTTFTNPTPAASDFFGGAVAAVGNDCVLIGASVDDQGTTDAGVAHLFSTNGTLLTTFTNPTPALKDYFGCAAAAVGADRVLIGAYEDDLGALNAGVAYLFSTNGLLLTTFTNPTPASSERFGLSVAAAGNDRVLIGASYALVGGRNAGEAYLFSTNGLLLTTFTNPTPASSDYFGYSVAAVGSDRVLIGAYSDNDGATDAGAAYLFDINGVLLTTLTNPAPVTSDWFGCAVAAADAGWLAIGAYQDDAGAANAGTVYLYASPATGTPSLSIFHTTTNTVAVCWPSPSADWNLQENPHSVSSVNWSNVNATIQDDGTTKSLLVNPAVGNRYYRLHKP